MRSTGSAFRLILIFVLLLCAFSGPELSLAQVVTVSGINGIVVDSTGAVVPGASVNVLNQATGGSWNASTNDRGAYSFPVLPPGTYTITISHEGFETIVVSNRRIELAEPAQVDIKLTVGNISNKVTVSAEGNELLTTATAEISANITPALVTGLPLVRRNFLDLVTVAPGVIPQSVSQGLQISNGSAQLNFVPAGNVFVQNNVFIAGARDTATNISVDGSNVQNTLFGEVLQFQSPATVEEMKVESANMSAEFGNGVAAINLITKSGTNAYHGELYEFLRNNKLDATPFFTNLVGRTLPNFQQNQFGASFGGPIKKNKLLFFANYEGMRVRQSVVSIETPPPIDLRTGDFSNYHPPIAGQPGRFGPVPTIFNPYNFDSRTGLRTPFPGNKIPLATTLCAPRPACVDPAALAYVQQFVLQPNTVVDGIPRLVGNAKSTIDADQVTMRSDWLKSQTSTIYGRYTRAPVDARSTGIQPLEGQITPYSSQNAVVHWTQTLSPTVVNDVMLSYTRPYYYRGRNLAVNDASSAIGLKNIGTVYNGGPGINGVGFDMDASGTFVREATTDLYELKEGLSMFRGRHAAKFGFEVNQRRLFYVSNLNDKGNFTFGNNFTRACPAGNTACEAARGAAGLDQGGMPFADYLLGAVIGSNLQLNPAKYRATLQYYGAYAQDSWRATTRLTINYGLRYEYWSPWLLPRNNTVAFDFDKAQVKYALQNPLDYLDPAKCYGRCAPLNADVPRAGYKRGALNFSPRLGLGYLLTPNTTLRASAGVYYDGNFNVNQISDIQTGAPPFQLRYDGTYSPNIALPQELMGNDFPPPPPTGVPLPNSNPPVSFRFPMPEYKVATMYQWSFSIQRRISSKWGAELSYLGEKTIREFMFLDMNAPDLPQGPLAALSLQQRRRFPQWGTLGTWAPIGWSKYNGLMASLKNNEWRGLTLLANYTFAKNIASSNWGSSDQGNQNFRYPYIWAGPYASTPYHRAVAGYSYRLPLGRGQDIAASLPPLANAFVSGWAVSGISTFSTGSPQWITNRDLSGTGLTPALPDGVCDGMQNSPRTRFQWFNTKCFVDPPFGRYGNSTLGSITIPGINNWDLTISKFTKTKWPGDTGEFELRLEMFNAFNHTQWAAPTVDMTNANYGLILNTRPPRQIQVALKFKF
jgi:hypothetical protein